jgi:hypothetical protein
VQTTSFLSGRNDDQSLLFFVGSFKKERGAQLAGGQIAEHVLKAKFFLKPSTFKEPLAPPGQLQRLVGLRAHFLRLLSRRRFPSHCVEVGVVSAPTSSALPFLSLQKP